MHLSFVVRLPHENTLTTKISQSTLYIEHMNTCNSERLSSTLLLLHIRFC